MPPADVVDEIAALSAALDHVVPRKSPDNVLIGTWNVRAFDRVSAQWRSTKNDQPIRDRSNVACIAEIVRRFDVVAIQEVRRSAAAFLLMLQLLGDGWAFMLTDVTAAPPGTTSGWRSCSTPGACNPPGWPASWSSPRTPAWPDTSMPGPVRPHPVRRQLRQRSDDRFTLVTLHVVYGSAAERSSSGAHRDRPMARRLVCEPRTCGGTTSSRSATSTSTARDDPLFQAFTSTGLRPPDGLNFVPRTIFDDPDPRRRRIIGTSTTRSPGSAPVRRRCRPAVRERRHVRLRQRPDPRRQPDATLLADLGPLPAVVRVHQRAAVAARSGFRFVLFGAEWHENVRRNTSKPAALRCRRAYW